MAGSILVGVMCFLFFCFADKVNAEDSKKVRVAFFPMEGYHIINENGQYDGMDVEYLEALCEYTNWTIEYVPCDTWEDALQMLQQKQVDLVGSAQYSKEREKDYLYEEFSSGYTFGVIATKKDSTIAYEDFAAMKQITFGMVKDYVRKDEFLEYMSDNGVDHPSIIEYPSTKSMQQALNNGEIDAFVHTFTEVEDGQRLLGRFAPSPFYYITYRDNDSLMHELNQAEADLKMNRPSLEEELLNKFYYSRFDRTVLLTTQEHEYVRKKKQIAVGYLDEFYPFSYEEDGEFKGLARELLDNSTEHTGLKIEYRKFDSSQEAHKALEEGEVDALAYCTDTTEELESFDLTRVCDYADIPLVLVTVRNRSLDDLDTLATIPLLTDKLSTVMQTEHTQAVGYATQQQCIDAVVNGEVDGALCDGYLAEDLMRTEVQYEKLQIRNVFSSEYSVGVVVRQGEQRLSGILKKTVTRIDSKHINEYMLRENVYPMVSVVTFLRNNSLWIMALLTLGIVVVIAVATHMIKDKEKIQKLMYKDAQMDIWNLNYLIFKGEQKLAGDHKTKYGLVYVNLEQFRRYSTIYGWHEGERLLKGVADTLVKSIDEQTEICARNQGDRFVMLLNYQDKEAFMDRLNQLTHQVRERILQDTGNHMSTKLGVYYISEQDTDLRLAISYANEALEFSENDKGDVVKVYDDSLKAFLKERHQRDELLDSVDINKDFVVYYQPKVDIRNGKIVGAEALVRFLDPSEGGKVKAPGFFVPYYEQNGRITEIDFFVFESVCKMIQECYEKGLPVVTVSCNFSRMNFTKPGFPEKFLEILERYHTPKELIEVEVTETFVVEELQQKVVRDTLNGLKEKGIRLSIDDFGSGYSSLGVFEQIPASVVKLDRSFLLNQKDHNRQVKLMRGIVRLSEELDAQIVCEGVETEEDVELMREIGAYVAQGYYYSRPIPEVEFEQKLALNREE